MIECMKLRVTDPTALNGNYIQCYVLWNVNYTPHHTTFNI